MSQKEFFDPLIRIFVHFRKGSGFSQQVIIFLFEFGTHIFLRAFGTEA